MTASGNGVENPMCVYRAIAEDGAGSRRAGHAAAVVFASLIGASTQSCYESEDTDADTDYGMPQPEYGVPEPDYGVPEYDGGMDDYGIPPWNEDGK